MAEERHVGLLARLGVGLARLGEQPCLGVGDARLGEHVRMNNVLGHCSVLFSGASSPGFCYCLGSISRPSSDCLRLASGALCD